MKKEIKYIIILVIVVFLVIIFLNFQENKKNDSGPLGKLESVEIKEYEGKKLSSIEDFRENSIKGPQYIDKESYKLKILGLKAGETLYSYDEVIDNYESYEKVVTLNCVEGWSVTILWEGILLKDFIDRDQVSEKTKTIIFRAKDGYSTSFPIDYIFDNNIIMAYKMNGAELLPERGFPFQLVAEDKYGYKWIKWITEIEFSENAEYEGYWESRGYSNEGNLGEKFLK